MPKFLSVYSKEENKSSAIFTGKSVIVDFLVFTRFEDKRLDYKFYFSSQNDDLTEMIRKDLIPESDSELPYEAFFVYKNYCVLMIAELWINLDGKVRKDNVSRDISRRSFFVWDFLKQPTWFKYEYLLVLLNNLQETIKNRVDIVPNEIKENIPKQYSFELKQSDFEDGWTKLSKGYKVDYSKFVKSNLKDVQLRTINITTPDDWTFDKQILLLKGLNISDKPYFVWNKLFKDISPKFEKLLANNRWITSDNQGDSISFYHPDRGNLIGKIIANEKDIKLDDVAVNQEDSKNINEENSKLIYAEETKLKDDYKEVEVPKTENPDFELVDIEIASSIDFLKREVGFFICSESKFNSSIFDSWNNLLNEIRVHYANTSKKQKLEWIRRLDIIRHILEEEIDITDNDRFAYETSFSLLTKRIYELIEND